MYTETESDVISDLVRCAATHPIYGRCSRMAHPPHEDHWTQGSIEDDLRSFSWKEPGGKSDERSV